MIPIDKGAMTLRHHSICVRKSWSCGSKPEEATSHESLSKTTKTYPKVMHRSPVYAGWRTMEYGPEVMSWWSLRILSSKVKNWPRIRKQWSRRSEPNKARQIPVKKPGENVPMYGEVGWLRRSNLAISWPRGCGQKLLTEKMVADSAMANNQKDS